MVVQLSLKSETADVYSLCAFNKYWWIFTWYSLTHLTSLARVWFASQDAYPNMACNRWSHWPAYTPTHIHVGDWIFLRSASVVVFLDRFAYWRFLSEQRMSVCACLCEYLWSWCRDYYNEHASSLELEVQKLNGDDDGQSEVAGSIMVWHCRN